MSPKKGKKKPKAKEAPPDYSGMLPAVVPLKKVGRPELISPSLANEICLLILEGYTIRQLTALEHMPSKTTLMRWAYGNEPQRQWFREQYAHAREGRAWGWAEEIIDIVDDSRNDYIERENRDGVVEMVVNHEHIWRAKLRLDARKWLLSKFLKKTFGKDGGVEAPKTESRGALLPEQVLINREPKPAK